MTEGIFEFAVNGFSGSLSAAAGIFIGSPFDVVKTLLQTRRRNGGELMTSATMNSCVKSIWNNAGIRGFFRGALINGIGQIPNNIIVYGVYGSSLRCLTKENTLNHDLSTIYLAGCFSGFVQSLVLTPFELVKIQQQIFGISLQACAKKFIKTNGLCRGLYRGW